MNSLQPTMHNQYACILLLKRVSQQQPLPLVTIATFLDNIKMNGRMLIYVDLPRPITGIWKPLLRVISGPVDIAIV
jgi:hypothetical protein